MPRSYPFSLGLLTPAASSLPFRPLPDLPLPAPTMDSGSVPYQTVIPHLRRSPRPPATHRLRLRPSTPSKSYTRAGLQGIVNCSCSANLHKSILNQPSSPRRVRRLPSTRRTADMHRCPRARARLRPTPVPSCSRAPPPVYTCMYTAINPVARSYPELRRDYGRGYIARPLK